MILFITDKPEHFINHKIIENLESLSIPVKVVSPSNSDEYFINLFRGNRTDIVLLKPDHWNVTNICNIAIQNGVKTINPAETTKFFKNRWNVENALKSLLESDAPNYIKERFRIPRSWYVLGAEDFNKEEEENFIKDLAHNFKEQIEKEGMILKFPINHTGFHFIRKINKFDDIKAILPVINRSGLIFQDIIKHSGKVLKCYCFGNAVFAQEKEENVLELVTPDNIANTKYAENIPNTGEKKRQTEKMFEEILEINTNVLSGKYADHTIAKNEMKLVELPDTIKNFMGYLFKRFNIKFFGIDIVVGDDDKYYILDFNDFPGCRGYPLVGEIIAHYLKKIIRAIE